MSSQIFYKGYTIEPSTNGGPFDGWDFYPTEEGRNDDADYDGEQLRYCGNVGFASSLDDAKDQISEKIMESLPYHKVEMNGRIYEFPWIEQAVEFASLWNGNLFPICNP